MDTIIPQWNRVAAHVGSLSTSRRGGVSLPPYDDGQGEGGLNLGTHVGDNPDYVRENRLRLQALLPSSPVWLNQIHGARVFDADGWSEKSSQPIPQADASVTSIKGRVCVIQTADCLPVLFCDAEGKAVGAAHAGWRGLAGGVLENTVHAMKEKGAECIQAWLGPAIGPRQFEVGQDVMQVFAAIDPAAVGAFNAIEGRDGKYVADIYSLARMALARVGVNEVAGGECCTVTQEERFYSYRRNGVTGRMASLIWLK
jgi:YfiH family protein